MAKLGGEPKTVLLKIGVQPLRLGPPGHVSIPHTQPDNRGFKASTRSRGQNRL